MMVCIIHFMYQKGYAVDPKCTDLAGLYSGPYVCLNVWGYNYARYDGVYHTLYEPERERCRSKMCRSCWFLQWPVCMSKGVYMYVCEGI